MLTAMSEQQTADPSTVSPGLTPGESTMLVGVGKGKGESDDQSHNSEGRDGVLRARLHQLGTCRRQQNFASTGR